MARTLKFTHNSLCFYNKKSDKHPIMINTAGYYESSVPFETYNKIGRLDYYLIYVIEGQLDVFIDKDIYEVKRGGMILFQPNYPYKYKGKPPAHYLYVHFTGSYADEFLKDCGFDNYPCIIENKFNVDVQNKFNLMIDTFLFAEQLSFLKCSYMLQEILVGFRQSQIDKSIVSPLKTSLKHIHSFYTTKIEIPLLAKMENLSNSRYIAVFKKQTGKSPNEYIIDLRMQFAKNLIENTNMSIKQISERVGYSDQYFFSRLFKKNFGVSPMGYRKEKKL